jgi:uncharacterized membrane protein HdeD (DUF308 family)
MKNNNETIYPDNLRIDRTVCIGLGIAMVILGTLATYFAVFATLISVVIFGAILFVSGLLQIAHAFYQRHWHGFSLDMVMGVLSLIPGMLLLAKPDAGAIALTLVLAMMFMIKGLSRVFVAASVQFMYWQLAIVSGIISFALGAYILYQWPTASFWIIGLFIGIDLIFNGWAFILLGMASKKKYINQPPLA